MKVSVPNKMLATSLKIVLLYTVTAFVSVCSAQNLKFHDTSYFTDDTYGKLNKVNDHIKLDDGFIIATQVANVGPGLVRYSKEGELIWSTLNTFRFSFLGDYIPNVQLFNDGNLYASAIPRYGSSTRPYFWKIDTAEGQVQWFKRFHSDDDRFVRFAEYDSNTFVSTYFYQDRLHIALLKQSDGDTLLTFKLDDTKRTHGGFHSVNVDPSGNVYVSIEGDLIKFNGNDFEQVLWRRSYSDSRDIDVIHRVFIDRYGDVFIFGRDGGTFGHGDGIAARIDPMTGESLWGTVQHTQEIVVSDIAEFKDSLFISYRHTLVGSTFSRMVTTKVDKTNGTLLWRSVEEMKAPGIPNPPTGLQMASLHMDVDCDGSPYTTGYYLAGNYGPGQWGTLKLDPHTGDKVFDVTISLFPTSIDEKSVGQGCFVFDDTLRVLGAVDIGGGGSETRLGKIDPSDGSLLSLAALDDGIQHFSSTLDIKKDQDQVYCLKQRGEELELEAYDFRTGHLNWHHPFLEPDMEGGLIFPDSSEIVVASIRKNNDALPPQPDRVYLHRINTQNGQVIDSTFHQVAEWDIKLMDLHVERDTTVLVHSNKDSVFVSKWVNNNPLITKRFERIETRHSHKGMLNIAFYHDDTLTVASNRGIYTFDGLLDAKRRLGFERGTEIYDHILDHDTVYLFGRTKGRSAVIRIRLDSFTIDTVKLYDGQVFQKVLIDYKGSHVIMGSSARSVQCTKLDSVMDVTWQTSLKKGSAVQSQEALDFSLIAGGKYFVVVGNENVSDIRGAYSNGILAVFDEHGDSIFKSYAIDEVHGRSYVQAVENTSDTSVWLGGAWNRESRLKGFLLKIGHDSLKIPISTFSVKQLPTFTLYPNPSNSNVHIKTNSGSYSYAIYDLNGNVVMNGQSRSNEALDVSGLATGMYVIRINDGTQYWSAKWVKSDQ